jgi:hypothetical protein
MNKIEINKLDNKTLYNLFMLFLSKNKTLTTKYKKFKQSPNWKIMDIENILNIITK